MNNEDIVIYTDGGCSGNPGPGGWACVIISEGNVKKLSGGEHETTNNRMELTAAIQALDSVKNSKELLNKTISVYSDSQYVKNGINTWIKSWKKNGWKTSSKQAVKNQDLWVKLDELNNALNPSWHWVKGHAGIEYNEVCDSLCQVEIEKHR